MTAISHVSARSSPSQSGKGLDLILPDYNQNVFSFSLNLSTNSALEAENPRRDASFQTVNAGLSPSCHNYNFFSVISAV